MLLIVLKVKRDELRNCYKSLLSIACIDLLPMNKKNYLEQMDNIGTTFNMLSETKLAEQIMY